MKRHSHTTLNRLQCPEEPGSYVLVGLLAQDMVISAGRFGGFCLPSGIYFYCGSALGPGGIRARISRHMRQEKKKHWHYDFIRSYLLLSRVWWADVTVSECDLCQWIAEVTRISFPLAGFGSSDCSRGCRSHLMLVSSGTKLDAIEQYLGRKATGFHRMVLDGI